MLLLLLLLLLLLVVVLHLCSMLGEELVNVLLMLQDRGIDITLTSGGLLARLGLAVRLPRSILPHGLEEDVAFGTRVGRTLLGRHVGRVLAMQPSKQMPRDAGLMTQLQIATEQSMCVAPTG